MKAHSILLALALIITAATHVYAQQPDPLFPVNDGDRTLYIDRTGKVAFVVPYPGSSFSEDLARVRINNHTGYIDRTGKLVI